MNADKLKQKPEPQINTDKTHQRSDLAQLSYLCAYVSICGSHADEKQNGLNLFYRCLSAFIGGQVAFFRHRLAAKSGMLQSRFRPRCVRYFMTSGPVLAAKDASR